MTLNEFCKDSWIEVKDGEKTYRKSRHCYEKEIDIYRAIARWQLDQAEKRLHKIESRAADNEKDIKKQIVVKAYLLKKKACLIKQFQERGESTAFSSSENERFMKCLICGVGRNRAVWREIRNFVYYRRGRNNWEDGLSECFHIMFERNLLYLFSFNLEKVEHPDNETVMRQVSGYIGKCLYSAEIMKECLFGENTAEELPADLDETIFNGDADKILSYIFSLFEKACHEMRIYAFVHEAISAGKRKSDVARKHKNRLRAYISECLSEEDPEIPEILEPSHAAMITDYIEESLGEGEECRIVICLKDEHNTAVQRITSLFEEARNRLKLNNFIAENKACIDKRSGSSFFKYEEAELIKFIRQRLNEITENISYFRNVKAEYIADEIGRMICEKEISV